MIYVWLAVGGALGTIGRYLLSGFVAGSIGEVFPWGTLLVNISGSFLIGFIYTLTGPDGRFLVSPNIRQFMMVGLCGGYTTFSSFSLQTLNLVRDGDFYRAGMNVILSFALCMIAVVLGHLAAAFINQIKGA